MNWTRRTSESFFASTVKSLNTLVETANQKQPVNTVAKSIKLKIAQTKKQKVGAKTVKVHMTLIHLTVRFTLNKSNLSTTYCGKSEWMSQWILKEESHSYRSRFAAQATIANLQ